MAVVVDRSCSKGELAGAKGQADQGLDEGRGLFAADSRWDDVVNNDLEGTWLVKALGSTAEWKLTDRVIQPKEVQLRIVARASDGESKETFGFGAVDPIQENGAIGSDRPTPTSPLSRFNAPFTRLRTFHFHPPGPDSRKYY